jgi:hypothetical protein
MSDDWPSNTESSEGNGRYRSQQERISVDESHHLLASERRRRFLSPLTTRSGDSVSTDDLADDIVRDEYPNSGPATQRVRIETDIHYVHFPKLAVAGALDYDPVAETVQNKGSQKLEPLRAASNAVGGSEE